MVDVYHPPASVIATWPRPNYVNPETHGPGLIVVGILMAVLGIGIVSIRIYARCFITRAPGVDDILIVLAVVFAVGLTILNIIGNVKYYSGYHIWDIPESAYVPHRINIFISEIFMAITLSFTKISVLLFYRRLSVSFSRTFLIAVRVGIAYNIMYIISIILALCLLCRPIEAWWLEFDYVYSTTKTFDCGNERVLEPLTAVFSSVSDVYTALLPMILISRLDIPSAQKKALYFLFSLAFLVVIVGIIRIAYIYLMLTVTYDFTWTLWKFWVLTQVEVWMAIFVASAPALKPMVKKLLSAADQSFSMVSQRMQGLHVSRDRYAEQIKESEATETNGSGSTKGVVDMENGIALEADKWTDDTGKGQIPLISRRG